MTVGQEFAAVALEDVKLVVRVLKEGATSRGFRARAREKMLWGLISARIVWV